MNEKRIQREKTYERKQIYERKHTSYGKNRSTKETQMNEYINQLKKMMNERTYIGKQMK